MTEFQKQIYNTFLRISRTVKGQPFKYRKDFSDFDESQFIYVNKLSHFFYNHKSVNIELYFKAPYEIYGKNENFYLDFYLSAKAHKAYTLYLNRIKNADPDDQEQLTFIVDSAKFIKTFCNNKNIKIEEYLAYASGTTPEFLQHLLQCSVSIYLLLTFPDFEKRIRAFDWELVKFILGEDFFSKLETYRLNFYQSKKAKILANKCLEKIINNG